MPFKPGNQIWKLNPNLGRKAKYNNPEELWEKACEYFQWMEDNPLYEMKTWCHNGMVTEKEVPKMRAMTLMSLWLFLDISKDTWYKYCQKEAFVEVTKAIESIIKMQKFEGAASDMLNANIIARDLGLRDATDNKHSGVIGLTELSDDELDAKLKSIITE